MIDITLATGTSNMSSMSNYLEAFKIIEGTHEHLVNELFAFIERLENEVPQIKDLDDIDYTEEFRLFELIWEARRDTSVKCMSIDTRGDVATSIQYSVRAFLMDPEFYDIDAELIMDRSTWPNSITKIKSRVDELLVRQGQESNEN